MDVMKPRSKTIFTTVSKSNTYNTNKLLYCKQIITEVCHSLQQLPQN